MTKSDVEDLHYTNTESISQPLFLLNAGEKGIIIRIIGGHTANKRLNELGLVPGVEVEVTNKITHGPMMIRVKGSKLALGRGLASKIEVKMV